MDTYEKGHAIPFITYVNKKGFVLSKEAEDFLNSLKDSHLGVISVVGKYRTGKSFFINRVLLNTAKDGFNVGPTINPCTKGLWLWSKTLKSSNPDYENMKVILIDTEGFGGMDEDTNHDTRIFLFALLLSSFFIYNSVGSIDESALQNLSLIVNLAKEIQVSPGSNSGDSEEVSQYFPSFLWVVRDFALRLIDLNGQPISPKEYLENALTPQKGVSDAAEAKNKIRRQLKHFFRDRDCCTMIRPLENEGELQKLDELPNEALREEFVEQLENVKGRIFRRVRPKVLNGKSLTGSMLVEITKAYIEGINSGKVPNIESAWNYVCKEESQKAMAESLNLVGEKLTQQNTSKVMTSSELKALKITLREDMIKQFKKKSMGNDEELQILYEELNKQFNERFSAFKKKNIDRWRETLLNWISTHSNLEENLRTDKYKGFYEFKNELDQLQEKFNKEAPGGINKEQIWKDYSQSIYALAAEYISKRAEEMAIGQQRVLKQRLEMVESDLNTKKKDFEAERQTLYQKIQELERKNAYSTAAESSANEKIENLKREKEKYENLYNDTIHRTREREVIFEKESKKRIDELESKLDRTRDGTLTKTVELEKKNALLEQELLFIKREGEEMRKKCENMEHDKKSMLETLRQKDILIEDCKKQLSQGQIERVQEVAHLKLQLEKKFGEISNDEEKRKDKIKQQHEWKMEKSYLENQVSFFKTQLEENKKLHDTLLLTIEQGLTGSEPDGTRELVKTNKNLSGALDKLEFRCKVLEEKIEKLKKYKRMIRSASALQCLHCSKFISCNIFPQHAKNCLTTQTTTLKNPNLIKTNAPNSQWQSPINFQIEQSPLQISINQTMVRETPDSKPFTEYMIQVVSNGIKWSIARQYKTFCELHQNLSTQFPNLKFPESAFTILGAVNSINYTANSKRPMVIEERRKSLEQYLRDIAKIDVVRNSLSFQKFLGTDHANHSGNINLMGTQGLNSQGFNLATYREDKKKTGTYYFEKVSEEGPNTHFVPSGYKGDKASNLKEVEDVSSNNLTSRFDKRSLPQSPNSFMKIWAEKAVNKENKIPSRVRNVSEDTHIKELSRPGLEESDIARKSHFGPENSYTKRNLSGAPTQPQRDTSRNKKSDISCNESYMNLPFKGQSHTRTKTPTGNPAEYSITAHQTEDISNKPLLKSSKSISRLRQTGISYDANSNMSGSTKMTSGHTSYNQY